MDGFEFQFVDVLYNPSYIVPFLSYIMQTHPAKRTPLLLHHTQQTSLQEGGLL